jgi:hypothetical protein
MTIAAVLPENSASRLDYPMADGLLYYFPAALAEVSRVSKIGNDQHNPASRCTGRAASRWITRTRLCVISSMLAVWILTAHGTRRS